MNTQSCHKLVSALAGAVLLSGTLLALGATAGPSAIAAAATSHTLSANPPADFGNVTLGDIAVQAVAITNNSTTMSDTVDRRPAFTNSPGTIPTTFSPSLT